MDENSKKFGENMKKLRLERKMSQGDFCCADGLKAIISTIWNLENETTYFQQVSASQTCLMCR
jgi:transcriptional regulator with XRE-family HTH domain